MLLTELDSGDQICYVTKSQCTDSKPASCSTDLMMTIVSQSSQQRTSLSLAGLTHCDIKTLMMTGVSQSSHLRISLSLVGLTHSDIKVLMMTGVSQSSHLRISLSLVGLTQ